ncbi:MAG: hypothetical protein NC250_01220 [Alistipes senegalensis]|nr:hypothetical protein [Alistipes senegalensis]
MDKSTQIRSLLRSIAGTDKPSFSFRLMEVVGVDGDLCRAKIDDFEIPDIRLSSIDGGSENGLLIVPAEGSIILVADISCGNLRELCAIGYSEIASIRFHQGDTTLSADGRQVEITVGNSKITLENNKIQFNEGAHAGLVKVRELEQSLESIKSYCETLTQAVSSGLKAVGAGAAANGPTGAAAFDSGMTTASIRLEKLENDKITH